MADNDKKIVTLGGLREYHSKIKDYVIKKPEAEGTAGQVLTKTAEGGETWMDSNAKTTDDIIAVGGPVTIDSSKWPGGSWKKDGNNIIPTNVTLQDLMSNLFSKDTTYTPNMSYGYPSSITKNPNLPGLKRDGSTVTAEVKCEVGTKLSFTGCTRLDENSTYAVTSTGCSNGHVVAANLEEAKTKTKSSGNYSMTYTMNKAGDIQLTPTVQGFKKLVDGQFENYTITKPSANQDIQEDSIDIYASDGDNYITVSQSGPKYSALTDGYSDDGKYVYAPSLQGKLSDDHRVVIAAKSTYSNTTKYPTKTASGSKNSYTIKGYRQGFYGSKTTTDITIDSSVIRNLTPMGEAAAKEKKYTFNTVADWKEIVVAVPSYFNVTIYNNSDNYDMTPYFDIQDNTSVYGANGFTPKNYKVYYYKAAQAQPLSNLTITIK